MTFYSSAIRDAVTLDFESERIEGRPAYPPKPVGLAVRYPDDTVDYFSWGHPTGNNCDLAEVRRWLKLLWKEHDAPLLFFNAKFDLAIAYEKLGLPVLPWNRVHDAQFLAFLANPHARELGLKELSEDLLDWPADEQNKVAEYVWDNRRRLVKKYGGKITRAKRGPYSAGAWLSKCPAGVVQPYAIGDVDRTHALFEHLYPLIAENGMTESYDRERQVLPIFMANEREGMHTDIDGLARDVPKLEKSLLRAEEHIRGILGTPDLNIDADAQLAEALSEAEVIDDDDWTLTKGGQRSVSKENLLFEMFQDQELAHLLFYRNRMVTALNTFMRPWLEQANKMDGIITTNWNQVRGSGGGTRTGRPSTNSHNFLNVPKVFKQEYDMLEGNAYGLVPLPYTRHYILPDPGQLWVHRDFDGQEMRVFAHYEDGDLLQAYQEDPDLDPHQWVGDELYELTGVKLERTPMKTMNFLGLYGGGAPAAAKKLNCSLAKAKEYKAYHDKALPGRQMLNDVIHQMVISGEPIRTWGGRVYFPETPKVIDGRMRNFEYKLINYLCQGSAADITKETMIRWDSHPKKDARFLVQVYDEINISAFPDAAAEQNAVLLECMESIELDLVMKSSGKVGARWGELEKTD